MFCMRERVDYAMRIYGPPPERGARAHTRKRSELGVEQMPLCIYNSALALTVAAEEARFESARSMHAIHLHNLRGKKTSFVSVLFKEQHR